MKMFGYEIKLEKIKSAGLPKCNIEIPMPEIKVKEIEPEINEEILILGYKRLGRVFDLSKINKKAGDPIIAEIQPDYDPNTFELKGFIDVISEYHISVKGEHNAWIIRPNSEIISIK